MGEHIAVDRLAIRSRPEGSHVMEQNWENLLFLHWAFDESLVRPLVPRSLDIDTFEDKAWIGITPFKVTGLRFLSLPPIPLLDSFNEINVRTYVLHNGVPGIYFFSLDASKILPALGARLFFNLPYFDANIDFTKIAGDFNFTMTRTVGPRAGFRARWRQGQRLRAPDLESLAFFLVERYCFFAEVSGQVQITRVYHHPWILEEANVLAHESSLITAAGLRDPLEAPLAHFSSGVNVQVWSPQKV
jgi:uncharacterized protein YqjF (DUF2071 family)